MFGHHAIAHIRLIPEDEARRLVSGRTQILATRATHERLAKLQLPQSSQITTRHADLSPGKNAIHLHYRGPALPDSGELPFGAVVSYYLIEVEEYQEASQ